MNYVKKLKNSYMEKKTFWNDAARWGVVLGTLLACSFVVEELMTNSGRTWLYGLMLVEWIAVVVLHFWLLLRFARSRAALCSVEEGFTFGQGYGAVMGVSLMAGVIVGAVQTVYLHLILGYEHYIERTIDSMTAMLAQNGSMPKAFEGLFATTFEQLRTAPVPSVLQTVWSGLFSTLLFGAVFGLIIAGITTRAPRPFDSAGADSDSSTNGEITE